MTDLIVFLLNNFQMLYFKSYPFIIINYYNKSNNNNNAKNNNNNNNNNNTLYSYSTKADLLCFHIKLK